jgi:hypothetical protein
MNKTSDAERFSTSSRYVTEASIRTKQTALTTAAPMGRIRGVPRGARVVSSGLVLILCLEMLTE